MFAAWTAFPHLSFAQKPQDGRLTHQSSLETANDLEVLLLLHVIPRSLCEYRRRHPKEEHLTI
jgi:hypothetical protein